jgi:glycosyltransferase involved in cell wall biosynthesis
MISVVIPVHNEAGEIGKLLQEFSSFRNVELVVAEDASSDGTPEIVQQFASRNHNVTLTSSSTLTGKGGAINEDSQRRPAMFWDSLMLTGRFIHMTSCESLTR